MDEINITVVGKIELPKKPISTERSYQMLKSFPHFKERLFLRYGIEICFKQYRILSTKPLLNKTKGYKCTKGILIINGVNVMVIKSKGILKTAIPLA